MIAFCSAEVPKWNPINICSYHLQEAGATPVQELAYALANAVAVLDAVRASGQVSPDRFDRVVGSISFFVNSGIRFVEEQYGSLGPRGLLGIRKSNCSYPASTRPDGGTDRYEEAADTSDDAFNLKDLDFKRESKKQRQDKRPVDAKPKTEDLKPRLETEDLPSLRPPTRIETPRPDTGTDLPGSNGKPINDASAELGALEATPNSSNRVARKNRIFNWLR
jgi:hypothetical protein